MNWKELKDFCNSIPDEYIDGKVVLWREDECLNDIFCRTLEDDFYIDPDSDDDSCYHEEFAIEKINNNPEDYPNGLQDFKKCYEKGYPILEEEI